jgi:hypothetical protein
MLGTHRLQLLPAERAERVIKLAAKAGLVGVSVAQ